jgi:hypothetical protein
LFHDGCHLGRQCDHDVVDKPAIEVRLTFEGLANDSLPLARIRSDHGVQVPQPGIPQLHGCRSRHHPTLALDKPLVHGEPHALRQQFCVQELLRRVLLALR